MASTNTKWQETKVSRKDRIALSGHMNKVFWFTGLSGSGKSTIASDFEKELHKKGVPTYVLDGDNVRHGLNGDLGFSEQDRTENIRRIAHVTQLLYDAGITVLVCFISPYEKERALARSLIGKDFVEVYVKCDLKTCEERDPKGLYEKARKGTIKDFTGIDAPYQEPLNPELVIDTAKLPAKEAVERLLSFHFSQDK